MTKNSDNNNDLTQILAHLGCNGKESAVYEALLNAGHSTATQLANETGIKRQTVYYILDSLVKRELVEQSTLRGVKRFSADIHQLKPLLDELKRELERDKQRVDAVIIDQMEREGAVKETPEVQYYQGQVGLKRLLNDILDVYRKGKIKTFRGYAIQEFYPGMEEFIEHFVRERHKLGVKAQVFVPEGTDFAAIAGKDTLGREMRELPIEYHRSAMYMVGDRIYLFSYRDGVGVKVQNKALAYLLTDVFDERWRLSGE